VTDGFDIVAVRVEHECAIVVVVVLRPQARWAVVASARRHRRAMKCVDLRTGLRAKRDVHTWRIRHALADPEIGFGRHAESGELFEFHQQAVAERRERGAIKRLGLCHIGHADAGMVDHGQLLMD